MLRESKIFYLCCDKSGCLSNFPGCYWSEYEAKTEMTLQALSKGWKEVKVICSQSVYHNDIEYFWGKKLYCHKCWEEVEKEQIEYELLLIKKGETIYE